VARLLPGYGLGPRSTFNYCAYGIGDTEEEALCDCLEMAAQQGFDVDGETEERIRAEYGPADDSETALEALGWKRRGKIWTKPPSFTSASSGIAGKKSAWRASRSLPIWTCSTIRITAARPLFALLGASGWGYTRRIDPDSKTFPTGT